MNLGVFLYFETHYNMCGPVYSSFKKKALLSFISLIKLPLILFEHGRSYEVSVTDTSKDDIKQPERQYF